MPTLEPATIDPRRHDAVLFDPALDAPQALIAQLQDVGVDTGSLPAGARGGATGTLRRRRGELGGCHGRARCRLRVGHRCRRGTRHAARASRPVVADLGEVTVRTGRPTDVAASRRIAGPRRDLAARRPAVFFDFDGTLSDIVDDPDSARLVAGADEALQKLAARCPVAILSGRDLADVTARVGLPGIWYAGSHGFELTAPDGTHHQNDAAAAAIPVLEQAAAQLRERLGPIPGVSGGAQALWRCRALSQRGARPRRRGGGGGARGGPARRASSDHRPRSHRAASGCRLGQGKNPALGDRPPGRAPDVTLVPIYLGDDITDEDAFDAVRQDGYTDPGAAQRRWRSGHRRAVRAGQSGPGRRVHRPPGPSG